MASTANSVVKRRLIEQLPVVNQTDTLKNFFAATIDNLFQPGESENISGYIGQKPVYYDPTKDFYLAESTAARAAYQLEPAMISANTGGVVTDSLCYDDLINYLSSQGAAVNNHSRLFEGDYYSWAPPVDLDKLNNYLQYVWMGSLTDAEQASTVITLHAPRSGYSFDGDQSKNYALPSAVPSLGTAAENPVVLVNGVPVLANFDNTGQATIDATSLVVGDIIETIRYGDINAIITGKVTLDFSPFLAWQATVPDYTTRNLAVSTQYSVGQLVYALDAYGNGAVYTCAVAHTASSSFLNDQAANWVVANNGQFATSGSRVRLIDGIGTTVATARYYIFDGVGTSIVLSPDYSSHSGGSAAQYIVIDRRSNENSPWSRRNLWVHISSLDWTGQDFTARKATRPIIEFLPDIELYNYGTRRLPDVQGILSNSTATVIDNWDLQPFDENVWDMDKVALSHVNGQFFSTLGNAIVGSVVVDDGYILQPNDRLFVHQTSTTEPALNNLVYSVVSNPDVPLPSGATTDVIELVLDGQPLRGDIIRVDNGNLSVFSDPVEYWYNGVEWVVAQTGADIPLFMLYDSDQNALNDTNTYPGTSFTGSSLFAYQVGTGSPDPVLGFPINYNSFSQPIFFLDPIVNRVTYDAGTVVGYYYQHFVDPNGGVGTFSNNWFEVASPSTQTLVNGVYDIPLNFQANPGNLEITTISRNQWFDHFSAIMTQQVGFIGQPYSVNNWRDTAKVLGEGDKILQHRSPLLKTMLISGNTNYDLPASLRYADQEYTRYRNKFVQTIIDLRNKGTLTDSDLPPAWVQAAIQQLRLNKTGDFAFAGSRMAGGQYFIPPTPASMGLGQVAQPALITDTTYMNPVQMIRGHDGSTVPAFGDWRDSIMVAFEQLIYDNIPANFKTESRPTFDLDQYVGGNFYIDPLGYTSAEINGMLAPYFQRWSQINRLDYRQNVVFDQGNPFSWNYSSTVDREGNSLPGYWRGIYRLYFDTDRPHLAPWEMLGFIDQPAWWQASYGPAPYTRGNTKMWDDLRDGVIAGGVRIGTDVRYARPDLYTYLPVDDEGNLLDPVGSCIVPAPPAYQQASAPWSAGDCSPVEALWRASSSFRFAQAQVGFLTKPARFVEQGWDTVNQVQDSTGQWIYAPTGNRPLDSAIYVHGETGLDGNKVIALGVQQWISDYMVSVGQDPANFGGAIRGLQVRLAHKLAGYTTTDNLRVLADNFGIVPSEDVSVQLYRSPSVREEVYSGVLIEWTGQGWRVIGYDTRTPTFYTIPGQVNGPKGVISLATSPEAVINGWRPNVYYPSGTNVAYQNTVYVSIKGHTSAQTFEQQFWTATSAIPPQALRVTTYLTADLTNVVPVSYGTVFTTYQQVSDFLTGYGRYLTQHGWTFDEINAVTQEPLDWNLVVKEFLGWAQVNWQPGNFITLSPGAEGVTFSTDQGMIMDVLTPISGNYGMLDRAGLPIDRRNVIVNRIDGQATLLSKNNDVFGARVNISEMEHVLIFSNTTIFNDIIYSPLFNLRQPRLRLIGTRSMNWTGRLDAPGYILINNQITSNFEKAATDLLTMYDIEKGDTANATLTAHARHVIGYDSRDYLASLVLSEVEQFEFYQGMIHQKGAPGAFNKLLRSDFIEQSSTINFFEEWAFKVNEYGAVDTRDRIAFLFGQTSIMRDPQYIEFRQTDANTIIFPANIDWVELTDSTIDGLDVKWIERPTNPLQAFPQRPNALARPGDLPVAGYVRLNEINYTVFNSEDIETLYNASNATLKTGEVVWVHENDEIRNLSNASASNWYVLGTQYSSGHWDGSNTRTLANSYTVVDTDGQLVFQSKAGDAPYITNDDQFVPVPGQTYVVTYTIRKTVRETDGLTSYVRPAFDAFLTSNSAIVGGLGAKEGLGYSASTDLIDTTTWSIGTWYEVSARWTCPSSPSYSTARGRLRINRSYPTDDAGTSFSNAIFQVEGVAISVDQPSGWDALKIYNMSADASINYVANVVTASEDPTISNSVVRIFPQNPHGLTSADKGLFYVIDGSTLSETDAVGARRILNVGPDYFEVLLTGTSGYDFVAHNTPGPEVRIMRSIHFGNMDAFNSSKTRIGLIDGDLAYVDGSPWMVFQRTSVTEQTDDWDTTDGVFDTITYDFWNMYRSQPLRMDAARVVSSLIYDLQTKITTTDLQPEPLSLDYLTVVSPLTGVIPGNAAKEIDFMLEYDPARYNVLSTMPQLGGFVDSSENGNSTGSWGPAQVGRVWWDLSTVRFLETETDNVSFGLTGADRYNAEVLYRIANWGQIAPATSIDVYEWTRSTSQPQDYETLVANDTTGTYTGQVYNPDVPNWVQSEEYVGDKPTTMYYFWVKNVLVVPAVSFRTLDVNTIAQFITNPMIEDAPWIAPIMPNGVLVGGTSPFVDDTFNVSNGAATSGTVLQIEIEDNQNDGVVHDEWILMRPTDERSIPPPWLWAKLRDSLVGFDDNQTLSPPVFVTPPPIPPVNKKPIWYTGPGDSDVPI